MDMFCYQCQEAAKGTGCTLQGICGKKPSTAGAQDLLIHALKGLSAQALSMPQSPEKKELGRFVADGLFATITNANFDDNRIEGLISKALEFQKKQAQAGYLFPESYWIISEDRADWIAQVLKASVLSEKNEDIRSLKELIIYGLKGIAAYAHHAGNLGYEDDGIWQFLFEALAATVEDKTVDDLIVLTLKTGEVAVNTMALLYRANTSVYGNPEISNVEIGVGYRPGILISGHDLKDLEELLEQSQGSGVDIYTHGEMLPAHYYPRFKKYVNFIGNYGNAWWLQDKEFTSFNGVILMTTNCITPVKDAYKDRIFTTGMAGYPGVAHIEEGSGNGKFRKDFSAVIERAKSCEAPTEIETGSITGGFAHAQVFALADKVVDAVKTGVVKRFVVMAGCDGRHKTRSYFTEVAEELPYDSIILTAGCAKYRYNKLELGHIGGIPRVMDAGQCNDSYSLALIALKLKEVFELDDINDLPISFDIAWYEQKAVAVLLALLHLGVKGIRLGPSLPAFLSENVVKVLVENFDIKPVGEVKVDVEAMMAGK